MHHVAASNAHECNEVGEVHLGQHACSSAELPALEPQEVDELHQVGNVLSPEMVLAEHLPPPAGLVLSVAEMIIQLHFQFGLFPACAQQQCQTESDVTSCRCLDTKGINFLLHPWCIKLWFTSCNAGASIYKNYQPFNRMLKVHV